MVDRYYGSYEAISIQSQVTVSSKSTSSLSNQEPVHITHEMVENLYCPDDRYDPSMQSTLSALQSVPTPAVSEAGDIDFIISQETINYEDDEVLVNCKHQMMIIYDGGDLNCALHFLTESLVNPFACNAVATVLVEERLREDFVQRVEAQMRPMKPAVSYHPKFRATLENLKKLNLETIKTKTDYPDISPILVFDCQHSQLGDGTTGVICLHTFRSALEAIEICGKDSRLYATTSIWNESIEDLYQLVVSLNCPTFFFNCSHVTLQPIAQSLAETKNDACVVDGFHYETLQINDEMKTIVFPIGAHLAQISTESNVTVAPISYLNE
ncbi:uncharacterized protein LOC117780788 [Drosophila innubila]|uniref:uncharacterized protein LOC117780788 n=1 Tax=Drosophila innubila TaxID=198719 RepID=UPI00148E02D8|nr:uncharacterized protein LOC117780788 [Drosophila innubila]